MIGQICPQPQNSSKAFFPKAWMNNEASESLMAPGWTVCMRGFLPKPVGYPYPYLFLIKKKTSTVVQFFCSPFRTELTEGRTARQADGRTDGRFVVIWFSFYVFVFLACGTVGFSHTAFFGVGLAVHRLTNSNHPAEETAPERPPWRRFWQWKLFGVVSVRQGCFLKCGCFVVYHVTICFSSTHKSERS